MQLLKIQDNASIDLSGLVASVSLSGAREAAARSLAVSLAALPDSGFPAHGIEVGNRLVWADGDEVLFDGFVFRITQATGAGATEVDAFDRGYYLNNNQVSMRVEGGTPEDMTRDLAAQFGFSVGALAATGHKFSRNFLGTDLYKTIYTAYGLASAVTGDKYHVAFEADKLCVRVKSAEGPVLVVQSGSNLTAATTTMSIDGFVSRVVVIDDNGAAVETKEDAARLQLYGLVQKQITQSDTSDEQAAEIMAEGGAEQTITVSGLGDYRAISGRAIVVREPYTGLNGLFWIEDDTHTWSKGLYTNKLQLTFKNLMTDEEVGELLT